MCYLEPSPDEPLSPTLFASLGFINQKPDDLLWVRTFAPRHPDGRITITWWDDKLEAFGVAFDRIPEPLWPKCRAELEWYIAQMSRFDWQAHWKRKNP